MDDRWIVGCAAGALLMRVGGALYVGGVVRAKNAAGAVLRLVADLCVAVLAFWTLGPALFNPHQRPVLVDWHLLFGSGGAFADDRAATAFRLICVALIATQVAAGALAERTRFFPSLAAGALMAGVVVPVAGRWAWHGWLARAGYHDLAGASVAHLAAAACAAAGAVAVGPRMGKYNRDGSANVIPGHNVPVAGAGTLLLFAAWFPYVLGFAGGGGGGTHVGAVAVNVLLAAAAGGMAGLLVGNFRFGKPEVYFASSGLLGGLVAITAGADVLAPGWAVATGAVAGVLVPTVTLLLDLNFKLDDPSGAIATHGVGGAWGVLAAGLFAPAAGGGAWGRQVGVQALGAVAIGAFALGAAAVVFFVLKRFVSIRVREADEFDGLDLAEHDINAYPDFQQTTIKSYHLREA